MDIKEFKEITEKRYPDGSLLKKYKNGYEAHIIDRHPHGEFYRKIDNDTGIYAFPEEKIMVLNSCGVVVVFLEDYENLQEIEESMKLIEI